MNAVGPILKCIKASRPHENNLKRMAAIPADGEKAFKPGRERKATDALSTTAALRNDDKEGF